MKKDEFMSELEEGLRESLNDIELSDILTDYIGFFDAGINENKSEDEVSRELGSPAKIARTIISDATAKNDSFKYNNGIGTSIPISSQTYENAIKNDKYANVHFASIEKRIGAVLIDKLSILIIFIIFFVIIGISSNYQSKRSNSSIQTRNVSQSSYVSQNSNSTINTVPKESQNQNAYPITTATASNATQLILIVILIFVCSSNPVIIIGLFFYVARVGVVNSSSTSQSGSQLLLSIVFFLFLLLICLYKPLIESIWGGRTIGKKFMGIRVVSENGDKAGVGKILMRELIGDGLISGFTAGITSIISIFTVAGTASHKSIPDYISSTIVIKEEFKKSNRKQE